MTALTLKIDALQAQQLVAEAADLLQRVPELSRNLFLDRLDALVKSGLVCSLRPAAVAGDHVIRLQLAIPWLDELRAAARASQVDGELSHGRRPVGSEVVEGESSHGVSFVPQGGDA